MCFVQSVSWGKKARTVTHGGGYVSARGFESSEVSVKIGVDYTTCKVFNIDPAMVFQTIESLKTDRVSQSGVLYIGGIPIYPELEYALTNINKTEIADLTGKVSSIECDLVFSGVKAVKNVVREKALELSPETPIPELTLSVNGIEQRIQDAFQITEFTTEPDSISLVLSIGSDLDLISRDGFLTELLNGGEIKADLPQGTTVFYVVQADLVDEQLSLSGSIYPQRANQILTKTYQDTDLDEIISDIVRYAGIACLCMVPGHIDYYRAFKTPIECLKDLQASAGFIMSYRQGVLTVADVPDSIEGFGELGYYETQEDSDTEPIHGCYWYDGINQDSSGVIDSSAIQIQSCFRSSEKWAERCLKYARYSKNAIVVVSDINTQIDTHSCVTISIQDAVIDCMVEWPVFDWVNNIQQTELHYL